MRSAAGLAAGVAAGVALPSGVAAAACPQGSPAQDPQALMRSAADTAHGSSQLAFTGVDVAVFVVIASILIAAGWGLVLLSRAAVRRSFAVDVAIRVCVIIGVVLGGCTVPAAQSAWASGSNVSTSADCQDSPPVVLPEVPQAVTLPITGMALGAGMYLLTRRRIRQNRPS